MVVAKVMWRLKNNTNAKSRCSRDLSFLRNSDCAKNISDYVTSKFRGNCTNDFKSDYSLFSQLAREALEQFVP